MERGALEDVVEAAAFFEKLLAENADIRVFLENPRLEPSTKQAAFERSMRGKVVDVFLDFLLVVIDRNRQDYLRETLDAFKALYNEKVGRVHVEAVTAQPLPEDLQSAVRDALAAKLGKQVLLTTREDPTILGGLVLRYDGMIVDGSVHTALENIRSNMSSIKMGSELVHED